MSFRLLIILFFLLLGFRPGNFAQDLFDLDHSKKFADYLFKSCQYLFAAEEYERILFLDSNEVGVRLQLYKSYRLAGNYPIGLKRFSIYFQQGIYKAPEQFAIEYLKLLILNQNYSEALAYLKLNSSLNEESKFDFEFKIFLLKKDWRSANQIFKSNRTQNDEFSLLMSDIEKIRYKSPLKACLLSTMLPGLGKVYTNRWKDGLISFMFVATNFWQAYRGFDQQGIKSSYGWIFGGLALGFYSGNIYGSYKSAKNYNHNLDDKIYQKASGLIFSGF